MTSWTEIANSLVDQDSPVTQTLLTALRDNPTAIAEGATAAPKLATPKVYGKKETELLLTSSSFEITNLGNFSGLELELWILGRGTNGVNDSVEIQFDEGSGYGTAIEMPIGDGFTPMNYRLTFNMLSSPGTINGLYLPYTRTTDADLSKTYWSPDDILDNIEVIDETASDLSVDTTKIKITINSTAVNPGDMYFIVTGHGGLAAELPTIVT